MDVDRIVRVRRRDGTRATRHGGHDRLPDVGRVARQPVAHDVPAPHEDAPVPRRPTRADELPARAPAMGFSTNRSTR